MFRSAYYIFLLFSFLIAGFVQVPSVSWAQDTVTQPELEEGAGKTFQELQKNNPGQLKKRPRALQQRLENRQDRRQGIRENRRDNRQDRRQGIRENRRDNRQGGDQRSRGNRGGGGRGRR